jgi:EAL domain-containing protein (putative c-di-GMP-specific phosphodiesterase class I)
MTTTPNPTEALALLASKRIREQFARDIAANVFVLFSQPILALAEHGDTGYREILIRFKDEEREMRSPGMFLPLLEEEGLMPQLDRWIVSRVLAWVRDLDPGVGGRAAPRCSVNLAADTIRDESAFVGFVQEQVRAKAGTAQALCFEIRLSELLAHPKELARLVPPLRAAGCTFALSNYDGAERPFDLARSLGFTIVKFDGSLVYRVATDPQAREKLKELNGNCRGYGLRTVAMQVENEKTLEVVRRLELDYAQGFGIERPKPLAKAKP